MALHVPSSPLDIWRAIHISYSGRIAAWQISEVCVPRQRASVWWWCKLLRRGGLLLVVLAPRDCVHDCLIILATLLELLGLIALLRVLWLKTLLIIHGSLVLILGLVGLLTLWDSCCWRRPRHRWCGGCNRLSRIQKAGHRRLVRSASAWARFSLQRRSLTMMSLPCGGRPCDRRR